MLREELEKFLHKSITLVVTFPTRFLIHYRDPHISTTQTPVPVWAQKLLSPASLDHLIMIRDPDLARENPVEAKYNKLNRCRSIYEDADLRPNSQEKMILTVCRLACLEIFQL